MITQEEITDDPESFRLEEIIGLVFKYNHDFRFLGYCVKNSLYGEFFMEYVTLEQILDFHEKLPDYSLHINSWKGDYLTRLFFIKK